MATRIAHARFGAQSLAIDATEHQARAHGLRGAIGEARGKIDEAAGSIGTVKGHVQHRREVVQQATSALDTSKQKAETVASQAPGIASQAEGGQEQTGPMASESASLASEAGGASPDDDEAAGKAQEQTGQISDVNGKLTTIDGAVSQTGTRAKQLQADAEQAKGQNAQAESGINDSRTQLDATDAKLGELTSMNETARGQVEGLAGAPDEIEAGAAEQHARAESVVANTVQYEARLHATQANYEATLRGLPGPPPRRGHNVLAAYLAGPDGDPAAVGPIVQRQAGPPEREAFPSFNSAAATISGDEQSAQERAAAAARAQQQQQQELQMINDACGGDFSTLSAGDKASLALRLTFSRTFSSLGDTNWPKFGLTLLRGFIDPRVSLSGVVSGFGMILSGGANLFSAQQWRADPLGNLLKSAADIATGVTIVLGSIAGLAVAIIAISAALILVSWGFLAPALLPVISICSTVAATVGPWAVTAAEVALVLNALVFIKNLIDAATAPTAAELQRQSAAMSQDVNTMGMMAMVIAGDKLGRAVGPRMGGALEGVQGRLAASGSVAANVLADNMADIGAAMSRGQRPRRRVGRTGRAADAGRRAATPAVAVVAVAVVTPVRRRPLPRRIRAVPHLLPRRTPAARHLLRAADAGAAPALAGTGGARGGAPTARHRRRRHPPTRHQRRRPDRPRTTTRFPVAAVGRPTTMPFPVAAAHPANDNALPGPEANEQVLAATGTGDVAPVGPQPQQPQLTVLEGGAGADAPRAMAGDVGGPSGPSGPTDVGSVTTTGTGDVPTPSGGVGDVGPSSSAGPGPVEPGPAESSRSNRDPSGEAANDNAHEPPEQEAAKPREASGSGSGRWRAQQRRGSAGTRRDSSSDRIPARWMRSSGWPNSNRGWPTSRTSPVMSDPSRPGRAPRIRCRQAICPSDPSSSRTAGAATS